MGVGSQPQIPRMSQIHLRHPPNLRHGFWFYQATRREIKRVTPPAIAPIAAPFFLPMSAPTAVAIPAVLATNNASRFHDRRLPPPHKITVPFIRSPLSEISG